MPLQPTSSADRPLACPPPARFLVSVHAPPHRRTRTDPGPLGPPIAPSAVPPAPKGCWSAWQPSLATTLTTLAALGTSAACALWQSDNSTAALTYGAMACMTGAVLLAHTAQAEWTRANERTEQTLVTASNAAARTADEVVLQVTQAVLQTMAQARCDFSQGLEEVTRSMNKTLETAADSAASSMGQFAKTAGVVLGTATALYVLGHLGTPLLLAAAAGQGGMVLVALLCGWSASILGLSWWACRCLL